MKNTFKVLLITLVLVASLSLIVISTGMASYRYTKSTLPAPTQKMTASQQQSVLGQQPTGIKMSNPQMSGGGMRITYTLELGADITSGLSSKSKQLEVSNQISSTVSQGYGLATDGIKSLLGLPGVPSAVDVLSGIVDWLNKNAPPCLRQIGEKYNGKSFKGTYTYDVKKGTGSALYPDWDYFYATETFTASGFSCTQGPTCVFSAKKDMVNGKSRGYTGELSKSCFG